MNAKTFNEWYRIGTPVMFVDDIGREHATRTRTEAREIGGKAAIKVDGHFGWWHLSRIKVLETHQGVSSW